jgi:hypothetical protein
MKTLNEEWINFRDKAYPHGTGADQNRQLHQAFFAGAIVTLALMTVDVPALPDDEAEKAIIGLLNEAGSFCEEAAVRNSPKG